MPDFYVVNVEFANVTMYTNYATNELEALNAIADMVEFMGEEPVSVTKDGEPWGWEPLDAEHPYQSVTIADMISDSNVMVL